MLTPCSKSSKVLPVCLSVCLPACLASVCPPLSGITQDDIPGIEIPAVIRHQQLTSASSRIIEIRAEAAAVDERAAAVRSELEVERKHCHHIEELRTAATCKAKVWCSRVCEERLLVLQATGNEPAQVRVSYLSWLRCCKIASCLDLLLLDPGATISEQAWEEECTRISKNEQVPCFSPSPPLPLSPAPLSSPSFRYHAVLLAVFPSLPTVISFAARVPQTVLVTAIDAKLCAHRRRPCDANSSCVNSSRPTKITTRQPRS